MKKNSLILVLLITSVLSIAQYPKVDIPGSQSRKIYSQIVNQEYELQILLPGGHEKSNKKFPVVYLMDSQWDFPLVKSIYGQQYYDGFIPELIIVGITWAGSNANPDSLRARDYTPTHETRLKQSGGADQFFSFMKKELFPFMESNYKADNNNRTIMGCSLGGLVTLYALLTQSGMFTGFIAASPAIGWDREVLYKYEKEFSQQKHSEQSRVYMTIGDVERSRPAYEKFAAVMTGRNDPSVSVISKVLENTGHSGTKSETYSRGLQFVFQRPDLSLDNSILKKYTGIYELNDGRRAEIITDEKKLVINFGTSNSFWLSAASETDFYSKAEFLNIHFKFTNNNIEGFQLDQYGRSQFVKKIN